MINHIYEGACEELGAKKPGPSSSRYVFTQKKASAKKKKKQGKHILTVLSHHSNFTQCSSTNKYETLSVCTCAQSCYFTISLSQICKDKIFFKSRQEKEAWIKSKYVEKRFLKKMSGSEALVEGERKSRPWTVKKCQRHSSSIRAPNKARRKYHRYEPGSASPANLSAGKCKVSSLRT